MVKKNFPRVGVTIAMVLSFLASYLLFSGSGKNEVIGYGFIFIGVFYILVGFVLGFRIPIWRNSMPTSDNDLVFMKRIPCLAIGMLMLILGYIAKNKDAFF